MCWKVILMQIGCTLMLFLFEPSYQQSKPKRSPLEMGYVQFTLPHTHGEIHHMLHTIHHPNNNNTTIFMISKQTPVNHLLIHTSPLYVNRWIPGHVENHAFIPGRTHHVLVPMSTTNNGELLVALHPITEFHPPEISIYRKHYGGFGVGHEYGGQGAGHGFHVI